MNNKTQNNNEKQQASGFLGKAASYVSGIATDASYAFGDMVEEMVGIPVNNNKDPEAAPMPANQKNNKL